MTLIEATLAMSVSIYFSYSHFGILFRGLNGRSQLFIAHVSDIMYIYDLFHLPVE